MTLVKLREASFYAIAAALMVLAAVVYTLSLPEVRYEEVSLPLQFRYKYLEEYYEPERARWTDVKSYPPTAFVEGIPWISYEKPYCASTCLQMIAYKYGINASVGYLNFLMGFTYGAYYGEFDGQAFFTPFNDPFAGYVNASRLLGLEYHLLVMNDKELFESLCRYLVSRDVPVVLPVNASRLYGASHFTPHFELLVGYDEEFFYLYEPTGPTKFLLGERGLRFPASLVVKAVNDLCRGFQLPWKYALIYFTRGARPSINLAEVLRRNGLLELGFNYTFGSYRISLGSTAISALAERIERGGLTGQEIAWQLEAASLTRLDNAGFLRLCFPKEEGVAKAAEYLEAAARLYEEALHIISTSPLKAAALLRRAAQYEAEAGRLLVAAGEGGD
ncbi:MAG: hypothetical protein DRJ57_01730 [Thermoprotei archaeon]|nr:MAG: hypothetical protein DRJ57_01730 [Thermoprotei archaeon]